MKGHEKRISRSEFIIIPFWLVFSRGNSNYDTQLQDA